MSAGYVLYSLDWDQFQQLVQRPTKQQLNSLAELLQAGLEENDGEFDEDDPIASWPTEVPALVPIVARRLALPDWYGDLSAPGKNLWEGVVFNACMNSADIDVGFRVESDGIYWDVIELAWKRLGVVPNVIGPVALSTFGVRPYRYHPPATPGQSGAESERDEGKRKASLQSLGAALGQLLQGVQQGKDPAKLMGELDQSKGVSKQHKDAIASFLDDQDDGEDDAEEWRSMHSMHAPEEVGKMLAELQSVGPDLEKAKKRDVRRQYTEELLPAVEKVAEEERMLFVQVDT